MKNRFYVMYLIAALILILVSSIFYQSSLDLKSGQGFIILDIPIIGMFGALIMGMFCFVLKPLSQMEARTNLSQKLHFSLTFVGFLCILILSGRPSAVFADNEVIFNKIAISFYSGVALILFGQLFLVLLFIKNKKRY